MNGTQTGVSLTRQERVAVITLDDGKANAMRPAWFAGFEAALDEVEQSDAGAVLLLGRPGFFCAGLDLKVLPTLAPEARLAMLGHFGRLMLRLFTFPRPVVAALSGHALGGGAILALAADVRLGTEGTAKFGLNEVAIGLPLPAFGVEIARGAVPVWAQTEMLLHGRILSPAEAQARHVLDELLPPTELLPRAFERAVALAALPTAAYALTKERLRGPLAARVQGGIDAEIASFARDIDALFAKATPGA